MSKEKISYLLIKLAVGLPFLYTTWSIYERQKYWSQFIPPFITATIPASMFLWLISIFNVTLASWIIFSRKPIKPALIAVGYLLLIVFFNFRRNPITLDIFFRDISIALTAIALSIKSKNI